MIVENMRSLPLDHKTKGNNSWEVEGWTCGQLGLKGSRALFLCGGEGYTNNRIGLKKLHDYMPKCAAKAVGHWEENAITLGAWKIGLIFDDN